MIALLGNGGKGKVQLAAVRGTRLLCCDIIKDQCEPLKRSRQQNLFTFLGKAILFDDALLPI